MIQSGQQLFSCASHCESSVLKQTKTLSGITEGLHCETSVPMLRFIEQRLLIPQ